MHRFGTLVSVKLTVLLIAVGYVSAAHSASLLVEFGGVMHDDFGTIHGNTPFSGELLVDANDVQVIETDQYVFAGYSIEYFSIQFENESRDRILATPEDTQALAAIVGYEKVGEKYSIFRPQAYARYAYDESASHLTGEPFRAGGQDVWSFDIMFSIADSNSFDDLAFPTDAGVFSDLSLTMHLNYEEAGSYGVREASGHTSSITFTTVPLPWPSTLLAVSVSALLLGKPARRMWEYKGL